MGHPKFTTNLANLENKNKNRQTLDFNSTWGIKVQPLARRRAQERRQGKIHLERTQF